MYRGTEQRHGSSNDAILQDAQALQLCPVSDQKGLRDLIQDLVPIEDEYLNPFDFPRGRVIARSGVVADKLRLTDYRGRICSKCKEAINKHRPQVARFRGNIVISTVHPSCYLTHYIN